MSSSVASIGSFNTKVSSGAVSAQENMATVMYDYEARTDDELSVQESETVVIIERDDGSGWVRVQRSDGQTGLVPTNYVSFDEEDSNSLGGPHQASASDSSVVLNALHNFEAVGKDEISLLAGEEVRLSEKGLSFGDGWAEIVKVSDGQIGIVPAWAVG